MSRFFRIELDEPEDPETIKLDAKVEETLRDIARMSSSAPEALAAILATNLKLKRLPNGDIDWTGMQWENADKLIESLKQVYKELPNLSTVMGHWTNTLSAYATYRSLKKQERLTQRILASNHLLAQATVILAVATAVLAFFSANSVIHFLG